MAERQLILSLVTDSRREEFSKIITQLAAQKNREERKKLFSDCFEKMSSEGQELFKLTREKETLHINHVRKTLDMMDEHPKDREAHDFSKDDLYYFVTSAKFDYRVKSDEMEELFRMETERHYELEPHHEQYEQINGRECTVDDVREMAIDRLSRNIQANGGFVDLQQMEGYIPNFTLGDNEKKRDLFRQFIAKYNSLAEEVYKELAGP